MAQVISIVNHKGGVGKTTITFNLAHMLGLSNKKVLALDLDPQGHLTSIFNLKEAEGSFLSDSLVDKTELNKIKVTEYIDAVPTNIHLEVASINLSTSGAGVARLKYLLKEEQDKYDYILIDCPPSLGILTSNALVASNSVLLVATPERLSFDGVTAIFDVIDDIREQINEDLTPSGIIYNLVDSRYYAHREYLEVMVNAFPQEYKVFEGYLKRRAVVVEAMSVGQPVITYAAQSEASSEFKSFFNELNLL